MSRRKRTPIPTEPVNAHIDALTHEGRGVADVEGKKVFIDGALQGEQVRFVYTRRKARYDEGRVEEVLEAAPERVEPRCPHFGVCGGCSLQHMDPEAQIQFKQRTLLDNLRHIGKVEPGEVLPPLSGPKWGYRRKARLGVRYVHKKEKVLVGFRERNSSFVTDLIQCDVLHPSVGGLLPELTALIGGLAAYNRIAQIEVAVGDEATALAFRNLDPLSETDTAALIAFGQRHNIQIYLQPGGPDSVHLIWPQEASLSYRLANFDVELFFGPLNFTQVNTDINRLMVERAITLLDLQTTDRVLDLFCGLGNFTLPLARNAGHVVGVEGEEALVRQAEDNARRNGISNVEFHTADLSADITAQPWAAAHFNKVLLDPPRSGAAEMMPHVGKLAPERIVYVSCHPATLARDAGILVNEFGYRLVSAGVMDMFPHTAHVESIALFTR